MNNYVNKIGHKAELTETYLHHDALTFDNNKRERTFHVFVGVCFEWSYIQCVENTLSDELNIGTIHIHNDPNKLNAKRQGELEEQGCSL